jgi:phosphatidylserine decarboxylase
MNYPHPIIAREGWPFIGIALGLSLMITSAAGLLWVFSRSGPGSSCW